MWVVPAPLSVMRYINGPRHLPADEESRASKSLKPGEKRVDFKSASTRYRFDSMKQEILQIVTLRDIKVDE